MSFKKETGKARLEYAEIVEECLCSGWIDSKPGALDDERSMIYIAPRKSGSNWSKLNKARAEKLILAGLMHSSGLEKIEAAKQDGSWSALDQVEQLEIPVDLHEELSQFSEAEANFKKFPRSVQRNILEWILNAKRPETRLQRIQQTARLAQENVRANQWRDRKQVVE